MFGTRKKDDFAQGDSEHRDDAGSKGSAEGNGDPDQTMALIDALEAERDALRSERDDANNKYKLALADFQNFQRRAVNNEVEAKRQGVIGVVLSILPIVDHFDLALAQSADGSALERAGSGPAVGAAFVEGIRSIRAELVRALELHGVTIINPKPNDEFDPNRHMAVVQQPGAGVQHGRVSMTLQPGYAIGERVIRSASVAVAPSSNVHPSA